MLVPDVRATTNAGPAPFLISSSPPAPSQERLAAGVVVVLIGALFFTGPVAHIRLTGTEILLPAYAAAVLLVEVIISALLLALYSVQLSRAVLALAIGYLFDKAAPDIVEAQRALKRIVSDGHRAGGVIESIRTMFKKGARSRAPLDLNGLVRDVVKRSRADAQLGRVSIEIEQDPGVLLVSGNPVQLQQVVSNLIANAIDALKFVPNRSRVLRIKCRIHDRREVLVSVEDTGSGIAPEHKQRIFEPFFTTKSEGMGMGLMFSKAIIDAHGGRLWTTDNSPRGAIFHFSLPRITTDCQVPDPAQ